MQNLKIITGLILVLALFSFSSTEKENIAVNSSAETIEIPKDVKPILKKSCFDCHHSDAKKILAKSKLNFEKLDDLSEVKKIATLKKIEREIKENKMPPKKYVQKNPENKLSEEDKTMIFEWINSELGSE